MCQLDFVSLNDLSLRSRPGATKEADKLCLRVN